MGAIVARGLTRDVDVIGQLVAFGLAREPLGQIKRVDYALRLVCPLPAEDRDLKVVAENRLARPGDEVRTLVVDDEGRRVVVVGEDRDSALDPESRRLRITAENRTGTPPSEVRGTKAQSEDRSAEVPGESRSVRTAAETRNARLEEEGRRAGPDSEDRGVTPPREGC